MRHKFGMGEKGLPRNAAYRIEGRWGSTHSNEAHWIRCGATATKEVYVDVFGPKRKNGETQEFDIDGDETCQLQVGQ